MIPKIVLDAIETGGTEFEKERARVIFEVLGHGGQQIILEFCENLFLGKTKLCQKTMDWVNSPNEVLEN